MEYVNILYNFECEGFKVKIMVTVATLEKHCNLSSAFIYRLILILYIIQMFSNMLDWYEFECSRAKVKITAISEKHCHCSSAFIYGSILI